MREVQVATVEQAIRAGLLAVFGAVNRAAARMAMEIMDAVRQHGSTPTFSYHGVMSPSPPLVPIESFYLFVVYADGTHSFFLHAAEPLRAVDPVRTSEEEA